MPRHRKDVEAALRSKGFVQSEGDHHYFIFHTRDGRKTRARTKTSHSPKVKELPDNIIGQMARQCLLSRARFLDLVDCPLGRGEYEQALAEQGET